MCSDSCALSSLVSRGADVIAYLRKVTEVPWAGTRYGPTLAEEA
ncbi:hypothetical protein ACWEJS_25300 [Rhodococcus triatomae]